MSIIDSSSESGVSSNTAVVWSLVTWITVRWPSKRLGGESIVLSEDGILLLDSVPWLLFSVLVKDLLGESSEVGVGWDELLVGGVFPSVGLAHNEDVVTSEERIWVVGNWLQDNF